jgi:serine/threonine protein kinase/Tol biopolymer transport system component
LSLTPGTRIGVYDITAQIGEGGMGQVYRATDTKLKRQVAIKILPPLLAADADRLARFQREAEVLASLNHPNIGAIYGLEESDGITALVMELVEGEDLSQRIARGAIPPDEALPIAKQIAEALEAAHEQGIIHRDLKPANVKVRGDGTVKVLDFGLAKAMEPAQGSSPSLSMSPTLTTPAMTQSWMILGTAAYMAPEQARGRAVDKRADIWAFGVVLFEMLTGTRAFSGEDLADTLAAVVKLDPAWDAVGADVPARVRQVLRVCLQKDPKQRAQAIGDVRLALEGAFETVAPQTTGTTTSSTPRRRLAWAFAFGVVALAALASTAILYLRPAPPEQPSIQFVISPPESWTTRTTSGGALALALSPDGRRLAFNAADQNGQTLIWVRSLDAAVAQPLKGTERATFPFWSPDSKFLAFVADGKLKKIDVAGGPPLAIADTAANINGGSWSFDGVILFNARGNGPLSRVSAAGGVVSPVTSLETGELSHMFPHFLPDGQHFLYAGVGAGDTVIYVGSLNGKARTPLLRDVGMGVAYSQGRLFFVRADTLMTQRFNAVALTLTGEPSPIAEIPGGVFSVSTTGVLCYQSGTNRNRRRFEWFDRAGKSLGALGEAANYYTVEISPDGSHAAGGILEQGRLAGDLWLYDLTGNGRTRLTFDAANTVGRAIWAPDGRRVVYAKKRSGQENLDLFQKASDGAGGEQAVLEDVGTKLPSSWSADGRFVLYMTTAPGSSATGIDLWVLPLFGDRKPFPYLQTRFNEGDGMFSPDGRWVAYRSNDSGRNEVYVAAFPGAGGKRQISTAGGVAPRWRRDGKEIFYLDLNSTLMAAAVNGQGGSFEVASVKPLFETRAVSNYPYDVSADGQRFLIVHTANEAGAAGITVAVNGTAGPTK